MQFVRDLDNPTEYLVERGQCLERLFGQKIKKRFKKTPHPWQDILKGAEQEYRFIDSARIQRPNTYTIISCSKNAKYQLVKHELKIPKLNKSASRGGYRCGLFIEIERKVVILFAGHHKDFDEIFKGPDNECFKYLFNLYYPNLYKQLE